MDLSRRYERSHSRRYHSKVESNVARFGIPESLVSDNGPCFISKEFKDFLRKNGVMHITSAPYHPASNGLAEGCEDYQGRATEDESRDDK